jgi:hypothetical protein
MACPAGFEEWTFDLTVDGASAPLRLTFCMKFTGFLVSGEVFDPTPTPVKLSDLMGLRVPTPTSGNDVLSLEFTWDKVRIFMAGFTFIQSKDKFEGKFVVTDLSHALSAPAAASAKAQTRPRAQARAQYVLSAPTAASAKAQGAGASANTLAQIPPDPGDTGTGNGQQT